MQRAKNTSVDLYQKIIDNSPDFVFESRVDNFQFTKVNERACKFYGFSKSEFLKMNIFDIEVDPPIKEQVRQLYDITPIGKVLEVFGSNKKKDGTIFPVHVRFSKINEELAIANVRDITEQKNNEKALLKSNINFKKLTLDLKVLNDNLNILVKERTKGLNKAYQKLKNEVEERSKVQEYARKLSSVVEQTADIVMMTNLDGIIEYVNPSFESLTGYTLKEAAGQTPRIIKSGSHDHSFYKELWETILSGKVYRGILTNKKASGDLFFEEKTITPLRDTNGNITHFVSTGKDVTERIKSEENLENHRVKLRALASRLEGIREEEKINIARKIHDELGQALTEIQFDLQNLGRLPELQKIEIRDELNSIADQAHQTLETLKRIATDLRPGVLDKLGLDAAIEWQLNQFQTRTKIKCKKYIDDLPAEINSHKSTTVFRIFQEILTNIIRHSQADEVTVTLTIDHNHIVLTVKDNGIGITKDDLESVDSLGLLGMQERANMTGGDFKIARLKKGGTKVEISIPV